MRFHTYWLAGAASLVVLAAVAVGCNDTETSPPDLLSGQGSGKSGRSLLDLQDPVDPPPPPDTTTDTTDFTDIFPEELEATEEPCPECLAGDPPAELKAHLDMPPVKTTNITLKHIKTGDNKSRYQTVIHIPEGKHKSKKFKVIYKHYTTGNNKSSCELVSLSPLSTEPTEELGGE